MPVHSKIPVASAPAGDTLRLASLGLMTAGIVHDLGNMVQVMSGAIRALERHPSVRTANDLQPSVADAVSALDRAAALTRQILSLAGAGQRHQEVLDIGACLAAMERPLRWAAGWEIKMDIRAGTNLPPVNCDRQDFENAVLNLVLNAREAMPDGGRISIAALPYGEEADMAGIVLRVSDTGIGMSRETAAHAFEPFYTTGAGGHGLGLSMVRCFAEEAGGFAWIESAPGAGTAVTVQLPAAR
ncbi:ATP-binding protein [Emcibacter sp. SYSU 3D8]|uniref:sensor histidine kinase n=1 Tax=Emcibacter sp. SYSU 3D8 TaxID=3133969 RepID=UPI0031FEA062